MSWLTKQDDEIVRLDSFRKRTRRWFALKDKCERCKSAKAVDRHHKDGNPRHNVASNIAHLCRRCHMIEDGRLDKLVAMRQQYIKTTIVPKKPCIICSVMYKPLRKGRCHSCTEYFRRNGTERIKFLSLPPRTQCKYGHEFTESNTWVSPKGLKCCRECHRITQARSRARHDNAHGIRHHRAIAHN